MAEYFEPISVLSLGQVLGLGDVDGDTLRRWFHGLAQGATNFEDDPGKWADSDATGAEIDEALAPVFERLHAEPDGSTIATMLELAEGTLQERVAAILPTLKVILLGGMQEPGHACGSTLVGLLESGQAAELAADPAGLVRPAIEEGLRWISPIGTQTRRVVARHRARRRRARGRRQSRPARLVGEPRRGRSGATPPTPSTCTARGATTPPSASGRISARVTTSRACRCGSRCSACSSATRASGSIRSGRRSCAAGSSVRLPT